MVGSEGASLDVEMLAVIAIEHCAPFPRLQSRCIEAQW